MARFGFTVAGEAHGAGLVGILTGLPRGIPLQLPELQSLMTQRRSFAGRGARSSFESLEVEWLAGVDRQFLTNGGPVAFLLPNKDRSGEHSLPSGSVAPLEFPRPGHADAAGAARWGLTDASPVAELASGRITAGYCVAGHVAACVLRLVGTTTLAHLLQLGPVHLRSKRWTVRTDLGRFRTTAMASRHLVLDPGIEGSLDEAIARAASAGDTLGGKAEIVASPVPVGLGAVQPLAQRLDARIGGLLMGLPGVKAVEIGDMTRLVSKRGSRFHDAFRADGLRKSNHAGGLEGGMTNGQPLVVRIWVKPVPTLQTPLPSVSLVDQRAGPASVVRSDVTAVAPTALAAEAMVRLALVEAFLDDLAGRTVDDVRP